MGKVEGMIRLLILALLLAGCTTQLVLPVPQPNLQTINLGQPNCHTDCHTTHTATQSIGPGDVQGATVSNTSGDRSRSTNLGAPGQ
jgi:hypothetical protein